MQRPSLLSGLKIGESVKIDTYEEHSSKQLQTRHCLVKIPLNLKQTGQTGVKKCVNTRAQRFLQLLLRCGDIY